MVDILGAVGLLAFLFASVSIGIRLLRLGLQTRGVPELSIGTGFVVGCVFGYVPETIVLSTDLIAANREATVLAMTQVAIRIAAASALLVRLLRGGALRCGYRSGRVALGAARIAGRTRGRVHPVAHVLSESVLPRLRRTPIRLLAGRLNRTTAAVIRLTRDPRLHT